MATPNADRTFAIPELVEAILVATIDQNNPAATTATLLRARRVCKMFKATIHGTIELRTAQWLIQPSRARVKDETPNTFVVSTARPSMVLPHLLSNGETVSIHCRDNGGTAKDLAFTFSGTQEPQMPTAIWGNMFAFPKDDAIANDKTLSHVAVAWKKADAYGIYARQVPAPQRGADE